MHQGLVTGWGQDAARVLTRRPGLWRVSQGSLTPTSVVGPRCSGGVFLEFQAP